MQEKLDSIEIGEVLDIYNELCSMIKSLEDAMQIEPQVFISAPKQ